MMNSLKKQLTKNDIKFTEKIFSTADSINGLGSEPFVSIIHSLYKHIVSVMMVNIINDNTAGF